MGDDDSRCLLHVEDDPNDALFIRRGFDKAGIGDRVRLMRDGEEAVAYLVGEGSYQDRVRHPLPALLVLDLKVPKKSGLEVLRWLRSDPRFKDLPVIILTSSKEPGDMAQARELGIVVYHVKPVDLIALTEIVKSIGRFWITLAGRARVGG